MDKFSYSNPTSEKDALSLLTSTWGDTAILAGGTDLISSMKDNLAAPKTVVNIKGIKALGGIAGGTHTVRIGATVTIDELTENPLIRKSYPGLVEAALGISSPQIRNMGTVGGDLLQRPRCWYYRHGFGLLGTANGKALVPDGENRYHAIFDNSGPAYFVSASSLGPALAALGASVKLASATGTREVSVEQLFVKPTSDQTRETAIKPNEILTEITIPTQASKSSTYEVREKMALDWPLVAASVSLKMSGNQISSARVVLGHVAPTPYTAAAAEKFLTGKTLNEQTAAEAGNQAATGATPLSQNAYKVQLVKVAVKRALLGAAKQGA
jgi:xanthine dehydrogenase YagS FAD-binding subunit